MNKLKFVVIGCGRISYKGIEAIIKNQDTAILVGTCDPIEEKAVSKKNEYIKNINSNCDVKIFTDYKKMCDELEFDVAYIATESGYHPEISIYLMNRGKHVIVEKPMALSTKDANKMIEVAKEHGVVLSVCHQNRFNSPIQKLRSAIDKDRFGRLVNGTARILWNRDMGYYEQAPWRGTWELDGGTLMNQCIHNIDLLQWMLGGEIDTVYAQCDTFLRDIEAEDFGAIVIRFKNGAIGIVEGSACVFPKNLEETLSIFGEKGAVCIGGMAVNKIETWRFEDKLETEEAIIKEASGEIENVYGAGHTLLFKNVIESISNGTKPLIDGNEGKKAMEIILAAYKSRITGMPIKFPVEDFSSTDMKNVSRIKDKK